MSSSAEELRDSIWSVEAELIHVSRAAYRMGEEAISHVMAGCADECQAWARYLTHEVEVVTCHAPGQNGRASDGVPF